MLLPKQSVSIIRETIKISGSRLGLCHSVLVSRRPLRSGRYVDVQGSPFISLDDADRAYVQCQRDYGAANCVEFGPITGFWYVRHYVGS